MPEAHDPYESYLNQATLLFERGEIVKAGQIWQAILKKVPGHAEARAGLYRVKLYFDSRATQDGPPLAAPVGPAAPQDPAIGRLLEEGCSLYDAGKVEEAVARWEQVLAKDSRNALAFGYLNGARRALGMKPLEMPPAQEAEAAEAPQPPVPLAAPPSEPPASPAPEAVPAPIPVRPQPEPPSEDLERLLRDGCTLYDMGEAQGALDKWTRVLEADPAHALARQYVADARRELGLPPLEAQAAAPAAPPPEEAAPAPSKPAADPAELAERADLLVRDGIQLFDMGMPLEAIRKWEQALSVLPDHKDAAAYLEMARREAAKVPAKVPEPAPAAPSPAGPDPAELQLPQATRLLEQGRAEEALFLFERILHRAPGHPQALQGRDQARARMAAVAPPSVTAVPAPEPEPAALPPAVATAEAPAPRRGPALPEALRKLQLPPWLMNPLTLMGVFFGILILWVAMYFLGQFRSNSRLRSDVQSIRAECLASVARGTEVASLAEDAAEIRREAERCLSEDPFRAYCRAQELLRLNPLDAPAAQLLDRAAKALPLPDPPQGDLRQVDKLLQGGEVEGAERLLYALLRQNPDQAELRARYQGVALALVQAKALKEHWDDARDLLLRGRALAPGDRAWQGRLRLLETLRSMGRPEREAWIPMLA